MRACDAFLRDHVGNPTRAVSNLDGDQGDQPQAEEVVLDFGLNLNNPAAGSDPAQSDVLFQINTRVVLNFYSAKRLALTLGQHIRRHEEEYGELELDAVKRRRSSR